MAEHLGVLLQQIRRLVQPEPAQDLGDGVLLRRFVEQRDEEAFTWLVQRHGPMVLGVCCRVLRDLHAAEDTFQATFVILARRAASLVGQDTVGNWLHAVALRVALRARSQSATRCGHEQRAGTMKRCETIDETTWEELRGILDEEIAALPERYRTPFVLHYLEGKTQAQTSAELKCPRSTIRDRLDQARELLRERLSRRGVTLAGGVLATLLLQQAAPAAVPALLTLSAVRAGTLGMLSSAVAALAKETSVMFMSKVKIAAWIVVLLAAVAGGTFAAVQQAARSEQAKPERAEADAKQTPAKNEAQEVPPAPAPKQGRVQGRITAADTGKPLAGATVRLLILGMPGSNRTMNAMSDAEGRYALMVPLGQCGFWGVHSPPGYYTQDRKTHGSIVTTEAESQVVRDFVLQPGSPWRVELHGVQAPADQPPYFSAVRDPDRAVFMQGESIFTDGDTQRKAVLTIPPAGGRYRFACGLIAFPETYEIPLANLEIDDQFDPRQIQGDAEPMAERKAVRLRDRAGRGAVVEGVDVGVDSGQAVLRFHARPVPATAALTVRGAAVDEAGNPVEGATFTAAFSSKNAAVSSSAMSKITATTDARGQLLMENLRLPKWRFDSDSQIRFIVVKQGYDGAQTKDLKLRELRQTGGGDFGTVVLKTGHTLRGKVVDENGQPLQGAVVTNQTNYFLYGHLRCRTDAAGRFVMPDLSFGRQTIGARYGEQSGQEQFDFQENSGDCVIAVGFTPKPGTRREAASRPRPVGPAQPIVDGKWDLKPPLKEPNYQHEPRYALLVFGPKRERRVWMVLDGTTLYVDRNANGDLTDPGERLEPNNPTDGSNRFSGSGMFTHFDVIEFTVPSVTGGSKFRLQHWIAAERFTPMTDFDKRVYAKRRELRSENSTLWRLEGQGQGQTPLVFMPKPADAQVCALDGPLTFVQKLPQLQVLQRGPGGCDLAFHVAVMGHPHRGAERSFYNPLATQEVPEGAHLEVEIEYPAKGKAEVPLRRKYLLKQRC